MKKKAAIVRLYKMLAEEISFLQQCEEMQPGDDIIEYHRNGVRALKKAIACLEAE